MATRLPLTALWAFAAAARTNSFSRAGVELNLSQGAVGQHVRSLEDTLGVALFQRTGKELRLTEAGTRLAARVSEGLAAIESGVASVSDRKPRSNVVTVSLIPSFASCWLLPRLHGFYNEHPEIRLRFETTPQVVDLAESEVDVAVRYGRGSWRNTASELLAREVFFPAAAPSLARVLQLESLGDLLRAPILADSRIPWSVWGGEAELLQAIQRSARSMYNDAGLLIEAAIHGQGVALVRSVLAQRAIENKSLVPLFSGETASHFSYYLVQRAGALQRPAAACFVNWLKREFAPGQS